jgi:hypothetical protein
MKITITTDEGEVIKQLFEKDFGDLSKPLPRLQLITDIEQAIRVARLRDKMQSVSKKVGPEFIIEDRDAALKNFQDQAKEAKINIKKIKRIKFLEFDSGRMHATGYFEVEYEGDEFPEDF